LVLLPGLALRIAVFVRAIWGQLISTITQLPPILPPDVNGWRWTVLDEKPIKKASVTAGFWMLLDFVG
jgi:hypothetical protein